MERAIKNLAAVLFFLFVVPVAEACYPDNNLILCWENTEGQGTVIRDTSPSGLNGTLTGGPAWVAGQRPREFNNQYKLSTATYARQGDWAISYSGTPGVETESPATSIFDFSSNKPYMIGLTLQTNQVPPPGASTHGVMEFSDTVGAEGWAITLGDTTGNVRMQHIGASGSNCCSIADTNPHRIFLARSVGNIYTYIDGVFKDLASGQADMATTGAEELQISGVSIASSAQLIGKVGNVAIYNACRCVTRGELDAFARNEYLYWEGLMPSVDGR